MLATFKEFSRILKIRGILGILVSIEDDSREVIEKEAYNPSLDIYYHYPSYDELSNYLNISNFEILSNAINTSVDIDSGLAKKWLTIIARKKW